MAKSKSIFSIFMLVVAVVLTFQTVPSNANASECEMAFRSSVLQLDRIQSYFHGNDLDLGARYSVGQLVTSKVVKDEHLDYITFRVNELNAKLADGDPDGTASAHFAEVLRLHGIAHFRFTRERVNGWQKPKGRRSIDKNENWTPNSYSKPQTVVGIFPQEIKSLQEANNYLGMGRRVIFVELPLRMSEADFHRLILEIFNGPQRSALFTNERTTQP